MYCLGVDRGDARTAQLLETYSGSLSRRVQAAVADRLGVRGAGAALLVALLNWADGTSLEELRAPLGISQPAATRILDRLVADGLATRGRRDDDRREARLALTPRGRRAARGLVAARQEIVERDLAAVPAADRPALARALESLLAGVTSDRVSARSICRLCDPDLCGHHDGLCPVTNARKAYEERQPG